MGVTPAEGVDRVEGGLEIRMGGGRETNGGRLGEGIGMFEPPRRAWGGRTVDCPMCIEVRIGIFPGTATIGLIWEGGGEVKSGRGLIIP
jgi:hypothetical protein